MTNHNLRLWKFYGHWSNLKSGMPFVCLYKPVHLCTYHNYPKYLDRQAWTNSVDAGPIWLRPQPLIRVCTVCHSFSIFKTHQQVPASVAQLDVPPDWRPGGHGFKPRRGRQHSFVEIDHEIFSMVILSLLLIQEGQLSVSGERMCTILVNRLEN